MIVTSSFTFIKSVNQSSIKPCLILVSLRSVRMPHSQKCHTIPKIILAFYFEEFSERLPWTAKSLRSRHFEHISKQVILWYIQVQKIRALKTKIMFGIALRYLTNIEHFHKVCMWYSVRKYFWLSGIESIWTNIKIYTNLIRHLYRGNSLI